MYRTLTPNGRPIRKNSFFMQIRKDHVREVDFFSHLKSGKEVFLPVRFMGVWETIKGVVIEVHGFRDGVCVVLESRAGSTLANWPVVTMWISSGEDKAGVLS